MLSVEKQPNLDILGVGSGTSHLLAKHQYGHRKASLLLQTSKRTLALELRELAHSRVQSFQSWRSPPKTVELVLSDKLSMPVRIKSEAKLYRVWLSCSNS